MLTDDFFLSKLETCGLNLNDEYFIQKCSNEEDYKFEENILYNSYYFEKIYKINTKFPIRMSVNKFKNVKCNDYNFEYKFGGISPEYFLNAFRDLIYEKNPLIFDHQIRRRSSQINSPDTIIKTTAGLFNNKFGYDVYKNDYELRRIYENIVKIEEIEKQEFSNISKEILDYMKLKKIGNLFKVFSIKIKSKEETSFDLFKELSNSYIFSLSYNFSESIIEIKSKRDFSNRRLDLIGRNRINGNRDSIILPTPKKFYEKNVIHYFQQGLSAENPVLSFLSYYQCLEYFYISITKKEMIKKVKDILSPPKIINYYDDYSDKEIGEIIKYIQNKDKQSGELNSLLLVLKEFFIESVFSKDLDLYGNSIVDKILNKDVGFANAPALNDEKNNFIYNLALRIYRIRNSLVHSKEGKDNSYEPFNNKHEKELKPEVLLIRLVAEQVIENSAKKIAKPNYINNFQK